MKASVIIKFGSFIAAFSLLLSLVSCYPTTQRQSDGLTLADASVVWWMGPGLIAQKQEIYKKNGLNVKTFDVQTGLASKNAVLSGSADVGLVATSPLATGAFSKENLIVLASYVESKSLLSIITPKDDAQFSKPTPPIAIVKGTISEIYFYKYMKEYFPKEDINAMNQVNVKPPDVGNAVKNGDAKSAVIWDPFATMLAAGNPNLKVNRSDEIYTHRIYIVTTPEILQKKRSAIEKFVKSISDACDSMKKNPQQAKEDIKSKFPDQEKSMNDLWDKTDFSIKFDYDNMKSLILNDAEVLLALGLTPKDSSGNPSQLKLEDIQYLFNHDFKLAKTASN